jgi:hypothetical protein
MKLRPRLILHSSSFILEEGRDNAASTPFFKTNSVGRIVPPLPHYFAKVHKPDGESHFVSVLRCIALQGNAAEPQPAGH